MNQSISVIVCVHDQERWDDLNEAMASLKQQTRPPEEIIIVVDHNPTLYKRIRGHITGVSVVENSEARGLSGARNSGIAVAQGDLIAFLDDDAVAAPDWLASLAHSYNNATELLGIGGGVLPRWEKARPAWFPVEFDWVVGCTYRGMSEDGASIRNPIGANMLLRREIFEQVGGFRSEIGRIGSRPIGCEETELCIRAAQHWPDALFLYHPAAQVFHHVPQKRATWRYFCARCYAEGLSKAAVARFVGEKDGLSSERSYTLRTLPQGVVLGLRSALVHGESAGAARAGAIIIGLLITSAGYLIGKLLSISNRSSSFIR
jgi:GT2 family glycosyltransferase